VVPVGVVTSSQTAGRAFDRIGPRPLVVAGQSLLAVDLRRRPAFRRRPRRPTRPSGAR
jgi:hypothetical protein